MLEHRPTIRRHALNLQAEDIGEAIRWIADRPRHMDVESIMIRPLDQV